MEPIVLLDFCGTMVDFQTFDPFLEGLLCKERPLRYRWTTNVLCKKICGMISRVFSMARVTCQVYKSLLVWQTRHITRHSFEAYAQDYYQKKVRPHLIIPVLQLVKGFIGQGYRIIIISGGADFYIRHFAEEYGIQDVITSQIEFREDCSTGFLSEDCIGERKVIMLQQYMDEKRITGVFAAGITDSKSDWPILRMCERKIVVSSGSHQPWVTKQMEEIVWG